MKYLKRIAYGGGLLVSALVVGLAGAQPAEATSSLFGYCHNVTIDVALAPGAPTDQQLSGTYCSPKRWAYGAKKADVLVHGGTYNRSYWSVPVSYPQYSYVEQTLRNGRATFAFDQIGTGASSRPLSALVTTDATAYVTSQAVEWVKSTKNIGNVSLVGHSMGSFTAIRAAAVYKNVDRVVVTGATHLSPEQIAELGLAFQSAIYPAFMDPQFAGQGYETDPGYLTTMDTGTDIATSTRAQLFYHAPNTEQAVVTYDENHKDVLSAVMVAGVFADAGTPALLNISRQVDVPVLMVLGQEDALFCSPSADCSSSTAVYLREAPFFQPGILTLAKVVPNTGHNLALHENANFPGGSFPTINLWIRTH